MGKKHGRGLFGPANPSFLSILRVLCLFPAIFELFPLWHAGLFALKTPP